MGLYEDMLARASPGGFPAIPVPQIDPIEEATAAQAARDAAALRARKSTIRDTPLPQGSLLPFGALGAGMLPPSAPAPALPDIETPAAIATPLDGPDTPLARASFKEADGASAGDPAALPPNSTPTADIPTAPPIGFSPAAAPQAAPEQPSIFGRLMSGLKDNSATLLALGAGFAGAPNIGQGISRAASAAIPASQADLKNRLMMQNQKETLSALLAAKVPAGMAMAALTNPEIMKAVSAKYLETKPLQHVVIKDALGNETPATFDQNTGKYKDMAGNDMKPDAAATVGSGGPGATLFAPGVKFDPSLSGEEYLNQFAPDVKAAVKAYINGDVMPTGNPRQKSIGTFAKTIAQKYGADMGIPVSDATFSEKRKYRMELGSNTPNSAGGQAKAFNQAVEHADSLATQLEKLGNYDPVGIPMVAHGINAAREALSTKQTGIADQARAIGQTLAGEVGKLFSGQAGGGVHERELTRSRFATVKSGPELAGALEGTLETMDGGLKALEQRRDQVLGPNNDVNFVNKETHAKIDRIREVIKRLRGEAPAAPAALPAGKTSNGVSWSIVQ